MRLAVIVMLAIALFILAFVVASQIVTVIEEVLP